MSENWKLEKKDMKKILSVISLVLMLLMSACNSTQPDNEQKRGETVTADNADQTVQSTPEMPLDKNGISEKEQTVERLSDSKKVWQYFNGSTDVPENEFVIENVSSDTVTFSFLAYRLDDFESVTAKIDDDGIIRFENVSGTVDNSSISGDINVSDNSIIFTISSSNHPYFESGSEFVFTVQSNQSALR